MNKLAPILAIIGGIGLLAIVVIGVVAVRVLPRLGAKSLAQSPEGLQRIAHEASKNLPKMVDAETRLNLVSAGDHMLIYEYDMPNYTASQMDLKVFHDTLLPSVRTKSCTFKDARQMFLDNGVTLRYHYVDRVHDEMATIDVTLADCRALGL